MAHFYSSNVTSRLSTATIINKQRTLHGLRVIIYECNSHIDPYEGITRRRSGHEFTKTQIYF